MLAAIPIEVQSSFQAKWPRHLDPALKNTLSKVLRVLWNVLSIVIFPIILCRLAYWSLRYIVLHIAVPGPPHLNDSHRKHFLTYFKGHHVQLTSPDGVKLDSAFFPGKYLDRAIIFSPGNLMCWETTGMYLELLRPLGVSIMMVNPRGIAKSEGVRSEEGFALDVYTAYEYLIHTQRIDPNNITHVGFSMGGGYGAEGAAIVQKKYPKKLLSAMNIRSFSDLDLEIREFLGHKNGFLGFFAKLILNLVAVKMEPKKALDTLNGRVCVVSTPSDGIIFKVASMIEAMRNNPKKILTHIQLHGDQTLSGEAHNRDFHFDERLAILEELRRMLHLSKENLDQPLLKILERNAQATSYAHLTPLKIEKIG